MQAKIGIVLFVVVAIEALLFSTLSRSFAQQTLGREVGNAPSQTTVNVSPPGAAATTTGRVASGSAPYEQLCEPLPNISALDSTESKFRVLRELRRDVLLKLQQATAVRENIRGSLNASFGVS